MTCLAIGAATGAALGADEVLERHRDRDLRVRARREADEPRLVEALRDVQLGGAGLAGDLDALQRGGGAGALAHDVGHHLRQLRGGLLAT